ncbi:MAG: NPCBM/NEW2 domain-containing protein [Pirellulales bacterium]|nr:NPCBM/NEW2 domain-containing protein [Pirellulales bacterium]
MIIPVLTFLLLGAAPAYDVQTLDGRTLRGTITSLRSGELTLETAEGPLTLNMDALQELTLQAPAPPPQTPKMLVSLVDGSVLAAEEYTSEKGRAKIVLAGGQSLEMPIRAVRAVQLRPEDDGSDDWAKILAAPTSADLLVVPTEAQLDAHPGILHDVTGQVVHFDLDGEDLPVKRAKVRGWIYHHPADETLPAPRGFLTDAAGSKWAVAALKLKKQLHWTTPAGISSTAPPGNLVRLDLSLGKIIYLSDLRPESEIWTPFFGGDKPLPARRRFFAPRKDKNFESESLRIAGKSYRKGLALHARTELVYRLPDGFHRLKAVAGIDDAIRPQGNVRLVIRGDGKVLWAETVTGADPPRPLELDVSGLRRLTILVDFGNHLGSGDYLDLGDARITK